MPPKSVELFSKYMFTSNYKYDIVNSCGKE